MKIRFTKNYSGSYGTFEASREVDLPPVMLKTIPEDCYVSLLPEGGEQTGESSEKKSKTKKVKVSGLLRRRPNE